MNSVPQKLPNHPDWEVVIGMETHVQLLTQSKMFSPASTNFGAHPNTQVHWLDCALPGTLPVANSQAIEYAIRFGLAINAQINQNSIFARKHYFYPDLPKGYQISQFEDPIVAHGKLVINVDGDDIIVDILRAHLEEDAGKLVHDLYNSESAVDLNRAGTPLIEIVTQPCMFSTAAAVAYAKALHNLVKWIGICDGNMQEGSFRCDANVSVRRVGENKLGTRTETKNLNSFRFLEAAINYEIDRQIEVLENGGKILQETRLFDPQKNETRAMRTKEDAHDYRYFPDPDLLTINIADEQINNIRENLPELPTAKKNRYLNEYGLGQDDVDNLIGSFAKAQIFENLIKNISKFLPNQNEIKIAQIAKITANWLLGVVSAQLNNINVAFENFESAKINLEHLAKLIICQLQGSINNNSAKTVFAKMVENSRDPEEIIKELGLASVQNSDELEQMINEAILTQPKAVAEFRAGKEKALMSIVGAIMKASGGRANAGKIKQLLEIKLKS